MRPRQLNRWVAPFVKVTIMRKLILAGLLFFSLSIFGHRLFGQSNKGAVTNDSDRTWALKSGLTLEEIHRLRKLVGVENEADGYIDSIDSKTFKSRHHILVVTAGGNGHCLDLYVFAHRGAEFRRAWAAEEKGYCRESPKNPESFATADGKIVVKIPVYDYNRQANRAVDFYTYTWNGRTYKYVGKKTVNKRAR